MDVSVQPERCEISETLPAPTPSRKAVAERDCREETVLAPASDETQPKRREIIREKQSEAALGTGNGTGVAAEWRECTSRPASGIASRS